MNVLKQFFIIFCVCIAAEAVSRLLPVGVPSNLIALGIMLLLFLTKIIKKDSLGKTGDILLSNMAFFLVPATVSIVSIFELISQSIFIIIFICAVTTFITFFATAYTVKLVSRLTSKEEDKNNA